MVAETKSLIQLGIAVLVAVVLTYFVNDYREAKRNAAIGEQRGEVLANTSAGVADGVTAAEVQAAIDAAIASGRSGYNQSTAEARRNEPTTAARDARPVPDSRLRAFRERRLARERRGCAGGERQGEQCEGVVAER